MELAQVAQLVGERQVEHAVIIDLVDRHRVILVGQPAQDLGLVLSRPGRALCLGVRLEHEARGGRPFLRFYP